jgi:GMP synthase (glutamine-hydrolysing)
MIIILDFGSQYTQLIARRIREQNVYCEILPFSTPLSEIRAKDPKGLVLSGGPASVYAKNAPIPDKRIFELGIPVLGICYGMQLIAHLLGGKVDKSAEREYGAAQLLIKKATELFYGLDHQQKVWESHGDRLVKLPLGYTVIAHTDNAPQAAIYDPLLRIYGVQFHPEVMHTPNGAQILHNFVIRICHELPTWTMHSFIKTEQAAIKKLVGKDKVILGLSGGVDSSVAAVLIHKAIGKQLTCVFVNNGVLRAAEAEKVQSVFKKHLGLSLHYVDAEKHFLSKLKGVTNPETKRKIIGHEFIKIFEKEARRIRGVKYLAQGTLYPDVIESISVKGPSATIKSHHNVGGLPKHMNLKLIEPLKFLFKDEVRILGRELGIFEDIINRQPFPGPGLAIRILGEVNKERLEVLRKADTIIIEEIKKAHLYNQIWQSFAVLLPVKSVGVMGDERTYENTIALRAVNSNDGMTADWVRLPYEILARISNRIINEVKGVNRVVYDISSKPPATIEWE